MIAKVVWLKPEEKPYFHLISLDCMEKLIKCLERFNKGEIWFDHIPSRRSKKIQNIVILYLNTTISCVNLTPLLFRCLFQGTSYMADNDGRKYKKPIGFLLTHPKKTIVVGL
jgi:hypothetical protein